MPNRIPSETAALRALLEELFPNCDLSEVGIALLAAQIAESESCREVTGFPTGDRFENSNRGYHTAPSLLKHVFD